MTKIKSEILAGITNYFTVIYIVMLVPEVLIECFPYGVDEFGEVTAMGADTLVSLTTISFIVAGISSVIVGLFVNLPIIQGPSLGIAAFVTYTICNGFGYTYSQALAIVMLSAIVFFVLSATGAEEKIHSIIPHNIKYAVCGGIGLYIIFNGLIKAHIIEYSNNGFVFFDISNISDYGTLSAFLAIIGLIFIIILLKYHIHAAIFIGKIACIIAAIPLGLIHFENTGFKYIIDISEFVFNMDFNGLIGEDRFRSVLTIIVIVFSICIMDIFETVSVHIAMNTFVDKKHKVTGILEADAVTTAVGVFMGMTNVSTYAESTAGIIEGGRTGITAIVTGILFLLSVPFAPFMSLVPSAATATTLIAAGVMMTGAVKQIDFNDFHEAVPAIFTMILMPFTNSIIIGVAAGIILYVLIHIFMPKTEKFNISLAILAVLFVIMLYFLPK